MVDGWMIWCLSGNQLEERVSFSHLSFVNGSIVDVSQTIQVFSVLLDKICALECALCLVHILLKMF